MGHFPQKGDQKNVSWTIPKLPWKRCCQPPTATPPVGAARFAGKPCPPRSGWVRFSFWLLPKKWVMFGILKRMTWVLQRSTVLRRDLWWSLKSQVSVNKNGTSCLVGLILVTSSRAHKFTRKSRFGWLVETTTKYTILPSSRTGHGESKASQMISASDICINLILLMASWRVKTSQLLMMVIMMVMRVVIVMAIAMVMWMCMAMVMDGDWWQWWTRWSLYTCDRL